MHTLSEQFHATNMVSFVCACVCVCGSLSFLSGAAGAFAADVLWLEVEDVGMQWSCQCSEC